MAKKGSTESIDTSRGFKNNKPPKEKKRGPIVFTFIAVSLETGRIVAKGSNERVYEDITRQNDACDVYVSSKNIEYCRVGSFFKNAGRTFSIHQSNVLPRRIVMDNMKWRKEIDSPTSNA